MGDKTGIEWTDATWNPVVGCSIVSPGCTNCYAMKWAAQRLDGSVDHYGGTTKMVNGNAVWTGKVALAPDHIVTAPLRWKKPRRIFVNSMGDLFHESVPDEWIDRVFAVMALAPQHTFQVLTKRSKRMREYFSGGFRDSRHRIESITYPMSARFQIAGMRPTWPLPNVWLGVSTEDQDRADERIPDLLATPASVRFVSAEPLLGPVDFTRWIDPVWLQCRNGHIHHHISHGQISYIKQPGENFVLPTCPDCGAAATAGFDTKLNWIIVGGESGKGARPMHPDWVRSIRDQCAAAGVPFFFKQWGEWAPEPETERTYEDFRARGAKDLMVMKPGFVGMELVGKHRAGNTLDGQTHSAMPEPSR